MLLYNKGGGNPLIAHATIDQNDGTGWVSVVSDDDVDSNERLVPVWCLVNLYDAGTPWTPVFYMSYAGNINSTDSILRAFSMYSSYGSCFICFGIGCHNTNTKGLGLRMKSATSLAPSSRIIRIALGYYIIRA